MMTAIMQIEGYLSLRTREEIDNSEADTCFMWKEHSAFSIPGLGDESFSLSEPLLVPWLGLQPGNIIRQP